MFGLSARETLSRTIRTVCQKEIYRYRTGMEECLKKYAAGDLNDSELDRAAKTCRKEYFNAVFDAMGASFRTSAPNIDLRFNFAIMSPGITGLPPEISIDHLCDNGISAGSAYAFCYYAITGKKVTAKDFKIMSELSHFQTDLMNSVLAELGR